MSFVKGFYDIGNWLAKMMYIHFLWVAFTIIGVGVFGISPATVAMVSIIHKWFNGDTDFPIFKRFYHVYKTNFIQANAKGFIFIMIGLFLYVDLVISKQFLQVTFVHFFLLFITLVYIITIPYFYTVFVRYELRFFTYFKQALFISLARPLETLSILLSLLLLYYLLIYVPVLLFFIGSSIIAYPLVWFAYRACVQVEEKQLR